jgi:SAM-dependent methyltransferase
MPGFRTLLRVEERYPLGAVLRHLTMTKPTATEMSFTAIDETGSADFFAGYLDFVRTLPSMIAVEAEIARLAAEGNTQMLIDVGCGTGDFLTALATDVLPAAMAVGIEKSALLVQLARRRHEKAPRVSFVVHDFARDTGQPAMFQVNDWSESADVIILNRVVQHLVEPVRLLENLRPLLKAGGRIIVADVDWGQAEVNGPHDQIGRAILEEHKRVMINPRSGAHLTQTLLAAGFTDAKVTSTTTHRFADVEVADTIFSLSRAAGRLITKGSLKAGEFQDWLAQCRELMSSGRFLAFVPQMVTIATV